MEVSKEDIKAEIHKLARNFLVMGMVKPVEPVPVKVMLVVNKELAKYAREFIPFMEYKFWGDNSSGADRPSIGVIVVDEFGDILYDKSDIYGYDHLVLIEFVRESDAVEEAMRKEFSGVDMQYVVLIAHTGYKRDIISSFFVPASEELILKGSKPT
jgi:hypothetical protein